MTQEELLALPHSKARAIALNCAYYYTAKPCKNGHLGARYTSSGNCIQCIADKRSKPHILTKGNPRASAENLRRADAAMQSGFASYTPEKPCKRGHLKRCVTTHNCLDCAVARELKNKNRKWQRLENIYGLSKDGFFKMLHNQNEMCAICQCIISERKCHVDHCHEKGHVRGLLCSRCNQAIGLFKECPKAMMKAIKYLEERS